MKYPLHNPLAYFSLYTIDTLLRCFFHSHPSMPVKEPRSLLICNGAHLGDLLLTTSLLQPLKEAFPKIHLGMVVGSWAKQIVADHPLIDIVHLVDHWKLNRSKGGKFKRYLETRKKTLHELRTVKYDAAIDCRFHFPNFAPLLWQAKIPIRIGFTSAGFAPLLTHPHPWDPKENRPAVEAFFSLLQCYPAVKRFTTRPEDCDKKEDYIVIHIGSGDPKKEWPLEKWKTLVELLIADGYELYFTGQGARERSAIATLTTNRNLCDQLNWKQFVSFIQKASLLIGVDSAAGHVAGVVGTPAVLLYTGIHPSTLWQPPYPNIHIVTQPMPCSPCLKGCATMQCVKDISVASVYAAITRARRALPDQKVEVSLLVEQRRQD